MKIIAKSLALVVLPLFTAGAWADVTQDCILEGTVDKRKAEQTGRDVYVAFHSAKEASRDANCNIGRRNRVEFKQSKDSGIEDAPHGATVKYRYTEENNDKGQWKLLDVSKW
ncbi:hypothetical protein [Parahaliea mediterranea]|uniref:Uncharacterized protein n=1 Tax=Parahaliea mediterranea TaxID=651086 RepID=A0A939DCL6_9GAMM|nr:hypothetical protein [Parahaliea mediterranea]MBN7795740.1 hypothetical protein [Parahaliea mediterranea]